MSEENTNTVPQTEKRDYVAEAVECFIKDAADIDPTDPVKAVAAYFKKNATDELKASCKAEGKNAAECWRFIEAVARRALGGRSGHIDPAVVYAIAMHYFQDVPKDWDKAKRSLAVTTVAAKPKPKSAKSKPAPGRARTPAAPPPTTSQTFFFDLLEGGDGNAH